MVGGLNSCASGNICPSLAEKRAEAVDSERHARALLEEWHVALPPHDQLSTAGGLCVCVYVVFVVVYVYVYVCVDTARDELSTGSVAARALRDSLGEWQRVVDAVLTRSSPHTRHQLLAALRMGWVVCGWWAVCCASCPCFCEFAWGCMFACVCVCLVCI